MANATMSPVMNIWTTDTSSFNIYNNLTWTSNRNGSIFLIYKWIKLNSLSLFPLRFTYKWDFILLLKDKWVVLFGIRDWRHWNIGECVNKKLQVDHPSPPFLYSVVCREFFFFFFFFGISPITPFRINS